METQETTWREVRSTRSANRRIAHAKFVVTLTFVLALVMLAAISVAGSFSARLATPWKMLLPSYALTGAMGLAAWLIGRRRAEGGYLALALLAFPIAQSLWYQRFGWGTLYCVAAITVVMRAADELNLKWRLPSLR